MTSGHLTGGSYQESVNATRAITTGRTLGARVPPTRRQGRVVARPRANLDDLRSSHGHLTGQPHQESMNTARAITGRPTLRARVAPISRQSSVSPAEGES